VADSHLNRVERSAGEKVYGRIAFVFQTNLKGEAPFAFWNAVKGVSLLLFRDGVNPSLEPSGKTCDVMPSCIAASQGPPSTASPLVARDEPLFFTPGETYFDPSKVSRRSQCVVTSP
jgi:hypothetical protein